MDKILELKAQRGDLFMQIEKLKSITQQAQKGMVELAGEINKLTAQIDEIEKAAQNGADKTENKS